jgi:hypothetical protein
MIALYIGSSSGLDFRFLDTDNFNFINKYYYIYKYPNSIYDSHTESIFINNLDRKMKFYDMNLSKINSNIRTYFNKIKNKTIIYYTNTIIPENYELIKSIDYDALIVAGHDPDSCILNNRKNINFIGLNNTYYCNSEFKNDNSVLYKLHNCESFRQKFNNYTYYNHNSKKIGYFNNFDSFYIYTQMIK